MVFQVDRSTGRLLSVSSRLVAAVLLLLISAVSRNDAQAQSETSFRPTWKLLSFERKQQFIAGYLQGWRDAARVTDIAITYIRKNPQQAVESLEGIRKLYQLQSVDSSILVEAIDDFYDDPVNNEAPLSRAVTAARARIQ